MDRRVHAGEDLIMKVGTPYFINKKAAVKYYSPYCSAEDVRQKLISGEIYIGQPVLKAGESLSLNSEGRYVIHDRS